MVMSALPNALSDLPTPALLLDWPVALRNIETAARFVDGKPVRLRPHFKNHKCPTLAIAQLAGGGCVGMTVATVAEAAALVDAGMDDILIANEVVGQLVVLVEGFAVGKQEQPSVQTASIVGE